MEGFVRNISCVLIIGSINGNDEMRLVVNMKRLGG